VCGLRNEGLTKHKKQVGSDQFCYFLPPTSNNSLSFEAIEAQKFGFRQPHPLHTNAPSGFLYIV